MAAPTVTPKSGRRVARVAHPGLRRGKLSTMPAIDVDASTRSAFASRVALVQAQLAPITTRRALLDSYRRESLCRLAGSPTCPDSTLDVLEMAYALRWAELDVESPGPDMETYLELDG